MKLSVFGAPLDTGNLGVSALGHSVITALSRRIDDIDLTVFDFGRGHRVLSTTVDGQAFKYGAFGSVLSSKVYRPESLFNMKVAGWFHGSWNAGIRHIRNSAVVLDITGGDSFTDMYGNRRFRGSALRKQIVLQQRVPLILLPQTYGPFKSLAAQRTARSIINKASLVWTRDQQSLDYVEQLFGNRGLPAHCKRGVDVAFLLTATKPPPDRYTDELARVIDSESETKIGINVSGLLIDRSNAAQSFALTANYREVLVSFIERLCDETAARIILVPHVVSQPSGSTSDVRACQQIWNDLKPRTASRVIVLPPRFDQNETKWIISKMDWFCGARMHSTVAALSSMVPASVLAYSDKAKGVFSSCRQEHGVIDLREIDTEGAVDALDRSWRNRSKVKEGLGIEIPKILQTANAQMDEIVEFCRTIQDSSS